MSKRKERPDGIVLYQQSLQTLALLPDEQAGKAIKAAVAYFMTGAAPDEAQTMEYLAFSILKVDVDAALGRFIAKCEQNRKNRNGGDQSLPVVTDGDQNRGEQNLSELNYTESEQKGSDAAAPSARDSRGMIFLDNEQYSALVADMGEVELKRCIDYLSEYCSTHNKQYHDWPTMIRKASREQWGLSSKASGGATKVPASSADFQPDLARIQKNNDWLDQFLAEQAAKEGRTDGE